MATKDVTVLLQEDRCLLATWTGLSGDASPPGDDGQPVRVGGYTHLTFVAQSGGGSGFDTNGVITIEGSMDGTNWDELHRADIDDGSGAPVDLELTASVQFGSPTESPLYVRPVVTTGDADVDLDVLMVAKGGIV